jgi:starvation-inducible DNA-binding protein
VGNLRLLTVWRWCATRLAGSGRAKFAYLYDKLADVRRYRVCALAHRALPAASHHSSKGVVMAKKETVQHVNIGISDKDRKKIADGLSHLLADTYTLYLKTHNFHWNVTGPMFNTLHLMFETQYNELALAVDSIAERIRALGVHAPGSYKEFAKLSSIPEADGVPAAEEMIRQLVEGQEAVVRTARGIFPATEAANDEPTADLLTQRMQTHEKTAWMLRSMLA